MEGDLQMPKSRTKPAYDNPFALNFDPMKMLFAGGRANAELFGTIMTYNIETLGFLKKRFEEDVKLAERMAACDEAGEAMGTCIDFLRQAQIDYSDEVAKLFDINTKVASNAARHAEQEAKSLTGDFAAATAA